MPVYLIVVSALIFISLATIIFNRMIVVVYTLESSALKAGASINIVLASDLHSTKYGKDQSRLLDAIKNQNPDLVLLTGDIIDEHYRLFPIERAMLFLKGIAALCPVFFVPGNHEFYTRDIANIRQKLKSFGIHTLSDNYERIQIKGSHLLIAGIEDPEKEIYEDPGYSQGEAMEKAFAGLSEIASYKILLAHHPERIESYLKYPFDLVVSGHAHGGQFRIPRIMNGLYAPHQGLFPKYAGGLYAYGRQTHIVSRGLAANILPRYFNNPELVVIKLKDSQKP
ncbi:metallophosphoesterase [Leadbettera azotonutricia]|uniref:metallophosphoesterase n=1 Tax=Leadbettera azotonutricia TaxID=150829 RepID=UPI000693D61E|nr:metallophosphoesterase [Leadbettera azotonutricia]